MATATIYGSTTDGYLMKYTLSGGYSEAAQAAAADLKYVAVDHLDIGWKKLFWDDPIGTWWTLHRVYLYFDTSTIPAAAEIGSATLKVYVYYEDTVPTGHDIVLYNGQPTYPSATLVTGDYNRLLYASGGADTPTIWSGSSGMLTFTLNSTGFTWITKEGTTKLCLRSEFDVTPTSPAAGMFAKFYATEKGTTYRPVLTVTYGLKVTVTTDAATNLGATYATANGTITDNGDGGITDYGAIWNNDGSDPVDLAHADNHTHGSDLAAGVFTASMTGLTASSDYYYRVYVTNAGGTACGSAVEFTTTAPPATLTVMTSEATAVADTTATLKGVIVEDAGDTVTQHGFIWKLNSDPYEEASPIHNPTGADNYVLLGAGVEGSFTTGVTGLDTGSVYMVRAFAVTTGGTEYGGIRVIRTGDVHVDTFYGLAGDGDINYEGASLSSYSAAESDTEAATDGASMDASDTTLSPYHGHHKAGAEYHCNITRAYVYFDTSAIPADADIVAATISLYCTAHNTAGTTYLKVYDGQPSHPTSSGTTPALELADYDLSQYSYLGNGYEWSDNDPPNAYVDVWTGASIVTKGGLTKVMFYPNPGSANFNSGDAAANKPKLVVTYTVPGDPPPLPQINVGGTMKDCRNALLRVGGQWRLVPAMRVNVGGVMKDCA